MNYLPMSRVALVAPFGMRPKATVNARIIPLAHQLRKAGVNARVFVPPWDDPERSGVETEVTGVPVQHARLGGGVPGLTWRLLQDTLAFEPDVIHVFKPIGYSAAVAQLSHWRRSLSSQRLSLVIDGDDWEGRGGWADTGNRRPMARFVMGRQERWCYSHADAVTTASDELRTLAWSVGAPPDRTELIPNGLTAPLPLASVETIASMRAEHQLSGATVLLYTRFAEFAPEWPAAMLAVLLRLRPDAVLLVVGRGLWGEENAFLAEVQRAGVGRSVRYLGWVEPEVLPAYLGAAQVAMVPFRDTLIARTKSSVKLLELMSLGLPVLASAVGENVRYLDHGRAGVLVPPPLSAEHWAAEIDALLADPGRRPALGQAAAARVRTHYLWDRLVEGVLHTYSLAGEHRARSRRA